MKEILYNYDNLKEADINRIVKRAKAFMINSNDEVLLAYGNKNYHFPGGHLEENETYEECLKRELEEETGISISLKRRKPFITITHIKKDYPDECINTKAVAKYYLINCDIKPDLNNLELTPEEIDGNFELRYIHKDKILKELVDSLKTCTREVVVRDTIEVVKEYFKKN